MDKRKSKRNSHRDNKATDKNIVSPKFGRKNEDIPMSEELKNAGCSASDCASCCDSSCSGCGSSDEEHRTITLTMDDNTEVECAILTIFPVEDKEYIALLPLDENGQNQTGEVYLYVFSRTEAGDPMLANIESDEEYEKAALAFDTIVQNAQAAVDNQAE